MRPYQRQVACLFLFPVPVIPAKLSLAHRPDSGQVLFSSIGEHEAKAYTAQQEIVEVDNALGMGCPTQFYPEDLRSGDGFQLARLRPRDQVEHTGSIPTSQPSSRRCSQMLDARLVDIDCIEYRSIDRGYRHAGLLGSYRFQGVQGHQVKRRQLSSGHRH